MRGEGFCGEGGGHYGNTTAALIKGDGWGGGKKGRGRAAHKRDSFGLSRAKTYLGAILCSLFFEHPVWAFDGGHWRQKKLILDFRTTPPGPPRLPTDWPGHDAVQINSLGLTVNINYFWFFAVLLRRQRLGASQGERLAGWSARAPTKNARRFQMSIFVREFSNPTSSQDKPKLLISTPGC